MKLMKLQVVDFSMFPKIGGKPRNGGNKNGRAYFLMDDLGVKPTIFGNIQIPPEVRCLIGMFLGSKYLQKPGVWKPRVSEFLETLGEFLAKKHQNQKNKPNI